MTNNQCKSKIKSQKSKIAYRSFLKGFSLLELLIVVTIVALFSVSAVAGVGYLGDVLRVKEVSAFLKEQVSQEELKVLRGDFQKSTIHFLKDYAVIEAADETATAALLAFDPAVSNCPNGASGNGLKYLSGTLTKKDEEGNILETRAVDGNGGGTICLSDFANSPDREWSFQLTTDQGHSPMVRFVHFNLKRDYLANPISITSGANARIELLAPYAKKSMYNASGAPANSLTLDMEDEQENSKETFNFP